MYVDGQLWLHGCVSPVASFDLNDPTDKTRWNTDYMKMPRPVGCTITRATPNYLFGSLTTYAFNVAAVQHSNAARTACDVGAVPAAGMTFITPNHCFCAPYLPGSNAFHPRPFEGEEDIVRLETGTAQAAPGNNAPRDWPMYMGDARRSNWTSIPNTINVLMPVIRLKWACRSRRSTSK